MLRGYRLNGRVARASRVVVGEYGAKPPGPVEPEPLIGADEVPPADLGLEPEAPAAADEPSLEDLIARVQGKAGREEDSVVEARLPEGEAELQEVEAELPEAEAELQEVEADVPEADVVPEADGDLPELEPDLLDPVADETLGGPALLSEDDFALGEPVEEVAAKKHRAKPRGKPRGSA